MKFHVLVADPPWRFGDTLDKDIRGAEAHYRTMPTCAIQAFPLPDMEDDALLFLWRVSSMQADALRVMKSWGFRQHSEIVWQKLTQHGKKHFGMGRIVRGSHETCLIGVRGRPIIKDRGVRSTFEASASRHHSEKPDEFFKIVERLTDGPYCELFARKLRAGWHCFGDELPKEPDHVHDDQRTD